MSAAIAKYREVFGMKPQKKGEPETTFSGEAILNTKNEVFREAVDKVF